MDDNKMLEQMRRSETPVPAWVPAQDLEALRRAAQDVVDAWRASAARPTLAGVEAAVRHLEKILKDEPLYQTGCRSCGAQGTEAHLYDCTS